jgi:hypothetical protein
VMLLVVLATVRLLWLKGTRVLGPHCQICCWPRGRFRTHWRRGESLQYQGEGPQELQDAI